MNIKTIEPDNFNEAISGPDGSKWQEVIQDELKSLDQNNTWTIMKKPNKFDVIDSKWVFKIQLDKI